MQRALPAPPIVRKSVSLYLVEAERQGIKGNRKMLYIGPEPASEQVAASLRVPTPPHREPLLNQYLPYGAALKERAAAPGACHAGATPGKMRFVGSLREPLPVPPDRKPTRLNLSRRDGTALVSFLQTTAGNAAVQRLLTPDAVLQRYRKKGSMNFGAADAGTLIEQEFKSKSKQPWISLITVVFDSVVKDSNGVDTPTGTATATYFSNKHSLGSFSVSVNGGPRGLRSDPGTFTVHRIEGLGYNDAGNAAQIAADKGEAALEGPKRGAHRRYTKPEVGQTPMDVSASMHLAVFYNRGEALHMGPLDLASHGCVHVANTDLALLTQLNYHSVIGRTKVRVSYTGPAKATFTR